jgi:hypothetical protein
MRYNSLVVSILLASASEVRGKEEDSHDPLYAFTDAVKFFDSMA